MPVLNLQLSTYISQPGFQILSFCFSELHKQLNSSNNVLNANWSSVIKVHSGSFQQGPTLRIVFVFPRINSYLLLQWVALYIPFEFTFSPFNFRLSSKVRLSKHPHQPVSCVWQHRQKCNKSHSGANLLFSFLKGLQIRTFAKSSRLRAKMTFPDLACVRWQTRMAFANVQELTTCMVTRKNKKW